MGFGNVHRNIEGCNWLENAGLSAIAFRNAHQDTDGCTWLERNKTKQVRQQWDSGMLTGTWMDAPGQKEIKKSRSVGDGIQECSPGYGCMHLSRKKFKKSRSFSDGIQECSLGHGWMHLARKK